MILKYRPLQFFLVFISLLRCVQAAPLEKGGMLKIKLEWSDDVLSGNEGERTSFIMGFKEALYDGTPNSFPFYTDRISVDRAGSEYRVSVTGARYELFTTKATPDWSKVQAEPVLNQSQVIEKKKRYIAFSILPFRRNPDNGKLERLVEFEVKISEYKNQTESIKSTPSTVLNYASSSVLSSGTWIKLDVTAAGIYSIGVNQLRQMGLDPSQVNPSEIRLFGNGGGALPFQNSSFRHDDLVENAIMVYDEGVPGIFDGNDHILFYGDNPVAWKQDPTSGKFINTPNILSDKTCYFLTPQMSSAQSPKRIQQRVSSILMSNYTSTGFDDYQIHEVDKFNFIKSGRQWYGEQFDASLSQTFGFNFPNIDNSVPIHVRSAVIAHSFANSYFRVNYNNQTILQQSIPAVGSSYTSDYADENISSATFLPVSSDVNINLTYYPTTSTSVGYLDNLVVNARRNLIMSGNQMGFRDIMSVGAGRITRFNVAGAGGVTFWDVTDPVNVVQQLTDAPGSFVLPTDSLLEFIAFSGNGYKSPVYAGRVENQNLHGSGPADMVIVVNPVFLSQANRLADFHTSHDNLRVKVVTPQEIYNEFSSGSPDLVGIRDYLRMLYNKAATAADMPKYLLLFGDGSYDNKGAFEGNTNFIPTYQSLNSISLVRSYVSDDFFGFLDDQEGDWDDNVTDFLDIGIGRFPVKSAAEADIVVNKTIDYLSPGTFTDVSQSCGSSNQSSLGDWRNVMCFIADDEDSGVHLNQSNGLANYIRSNYPRFNVDKIFIDSYNQVSTPGGQRYPAVNEAITRRVDKGALVINYTGHGGETGWTAERILDNTMIQSWTNKRKLPLFITATCEFSRYDDPGRTSSGELILINSEAGGVALMTTTRLVYAAQNGVLNSVMIENLFDPVNGQQPRLGDVYITTKNNSSVLSGGVNPRNFSLLGDPAIRLAVPQFDVVTTGINGSAPVANADTLAALQKVTITGEIRSNGQKLTGFNGIVYPTVYDKEESVTTLSNDPTSPSITFSLRKNAVYRGKASVTNGSFTFTFVVPRDIAYNLGRGRFSFYAHNGTEDASGNYDSLIIGGSYPSTIIDNTGPSVKLFLNDEKFAFGGLTDQNPVIVAMVKDSNGVNTVGNGIGHDITAQIDDDPNRVYILNDYYESDLDDYTSGKIRFPLQGLSSGIHRLKLKVWDIYNNSGEAYTEFVVAESATLALDHVLNYPNPFTSRTSFFFEHNRPCGNLDVQIQVYTVSGRLVKTINSVVGCNGYRSDGVEWDGKDDFGDNIGRGVYVYRLKVRAEDGSTAEKYEKLVVLK